MGKSPVKSSYHVTHHITATVSHSLYRDLRPDKK